MRSVLLAIFLLTAACGKSDYGGRSEKIMIDPIEESGAEICNTKQPCTAELNEVGKDDGFY